MTMYNRGARPGAGKLAALALIMAAGAAAADSANWPPDSSYRQSCKDIRMDGKTLRANCEDQDGKWVSASLENARDHNGNIGNCNGILTVGACPQPPQGPYTKSCREIRMKGTTLHAECRRRGCKDVAGVDWNCIWDQRALINATPAAAAGISIENCDGVLKLGSCGGSPPAGEYLKSCIDVNLSGTTLHANCKNNKGGWTLTSLANAKAHPGIAIVNCNGVLKFNNCR
jgi:hypothetical protein